MIYWNGSLNSYTNTIGKKRMIYIIKTKFNYGVQSEEKNTPNLRESPSFFHLIKCSQYYFNERAASHFNECIFFYFSSSYSSIYTKMKISAMSVVICRWYWSLFFQLKWRKHALFNTTAGYDVFARCDEYTVYYRKCYKITVSKNLFT